MRSSSDKYTITLDGGALKVPLHRFAHEAMNTIFGVSILGGDADFAQSAARVAFEKVDRLEQLFSRFIEGSDVWRINHLSAGSWTPVDTDTLNCIQLAQTIADQTNGAFDITIGSLHNWWRQNDKPDQSNTEFEHAAVRTGMDLLEINQQAHGVGVRTDDIQIDLGGIGKGYAVDQMIQMLKEFDIKNALAHGGQSTIFALGAIPEHPGWPMIITNPGQPAANHAKKINISNQSLSGSGAQIQGDHIIDPRSCQPARDKLRAYALAESAARADALSTAFIIMSIDEIEKYCQQQQNTGAIIAIQEQGKSCMKLLGVLNL
ncbi:MAG: FAD:protein FMN transferase [Planctomycetes bacterium]|nr:FAD:protein FMN transferase [Planctomycetota bacterium]